MDEKSGKESVSGKMVYIEVDYDDVVYKKINVIKKTESLLNHLAQNEEEMKHVVFEDKSINGPHYKLFSQDIRKTDEMRAKLMAMNIDLSVPTLVITECLMVYLKKTESDVILEGISKLFVGDLAYVNYEMINPGDAFGKIMIENL